jgi:hypothetical protein
MNNCQYGDKCTYAHGDKELRKLSVGQAHQIPPPPTPPMPPQVQQMAPASMSSYPVLAAGLPATAFPALGAT